MMGVTRSVFALLLAVALGGCSTPYQGIRFRADAPPIDEAFRKVSLALTTDGFALRDVDAKGHRLETDWKTLSAVEMAEGDGRGTTEGKVDVRLEARGRMYDVYVTPLLRGVGGPEEVAGVHHPFRLKWEKVLRMLLRKELPDEG